MHPSLYLSEADRLRLRSIIDSTSQFPRPSPAQKSALEEILSKAITPPNTDDLWNHVGLNDRVSLVSPRDSRDYFNLQIVMPAESDPDQERISVLLPLSIGVIGRRCGETVSWEGPCGLREMRIIAVTKFEEMAV